MDSVFRPCVRVLIVDDHDNYPGLVCDSADIWNEHFAFECKKARSVQEAKDEVEEWLPRVILVDPFVPDLSLTEFADYCLGRSISLVVMSENSVDGLSELVERIGAVGYIPKSEDPDDVQFLLERIAEIADEALIEQ